MGGPTIRPKLEQNRDYIINAYQSGKSIDDLSNEFSCSNTPIRKFLIAHNINFRPPIRPKILEQYRDEIEALYRQGWNTRQIAEKYKVDPNTTSQFLKSLGVRRKSALTKLKFNIEGQGNIGMLAGLLLGEGSIIIRGNGTQIRIVNQDKDIIDWLSQWGGKVYWTGPRKRCPNPVAVWDLAGAVDVFHCLNLLVPYLVGRKKELAIKAINHLSNNYGFRLPETP